MSMFDNNDKDAMYEELTDFLKCYPLHELFYIMSVVFELHPELPLKGGDKDGN